MLASLVRQLVIERAAGAERLIMRREFLRILFVIVHVVDIGDDMVVAARIDARTGRVKHLRHTVNHSERGTKLGAAVSVPRLVERAPADNRRMVEVARDGVDPLALEGLQRCRVGKIQAPVRHLAPGEVAQTVAVVEEAGLEYLLMQARAVEAGREAQLDVAHESGLVRGRVDAVRVEALVEHKTLENRSAVEQNTHAVDRNLAQARVALHGILAEGERQIIQVARARIPEMNLGESERYGRHAVLRLDGRLAARTALEEGLHGENAGPAQLGLDGQRPGGDIREVFDALYIALRHKLEPHRLPDAGRAGVVAVVGIEKLALLAVGLLAGAVVVDGADGQAVLALGAQSRDIKAERRVAAAVGSGLFAVDIDVGLVVNRAEVQQDAARELLLCHGERAQIPHGGDEVLAADAGELAFRAERHGDGVLERLALLEMAVEAAFAEVKRKLPLAVEVLPSGALELRLGMLRSRNGMQHDKLLLNAF